MKNDTMRICMAQGDERVSGSIRRSTDWIRLAMVVHAVVINLLRLDVAHQPVVMIVVSSVMVAWSLVMVLYGRRNCRIRRNLDLCDIGITAVIVILSGPVLGTEVLRSTTFGLGGFWMLMAPVTVAMYTGSAVGAGAGLVLGAIQFLEAPSLDPRVWTHLIITVTVPYLVGLLIKVNNEAIAERNRSVATAVALEERERLNRIVHDGVLQVLAMVAREGHELGPRGKMLALLARKQEDQLRTTLQDKHVDVTKGEYLDADTTDLTTMLEKHQSKTVTVSTMAGHVSMTTDRAKELDRVITEVLSNVFKHAGVNAKSWILLEEEKGQVIITVRDDGIGMTPERLQAAADAGRLGVKESIVGRILSLGGTSTLDSAPGKGTEWEFRVPLQ